MSASVAAALLSSMRCDYCSNGYAKRNRSCPLCGFPHRQANAISFGLGALAISKGIRLLKLFMGGA